MKNKVIYGALGIGTLIVAGGIALCPGNKQEEPITTLIEETITQQAPPVQISPRKYTVKKGDYPSIIVQRELELKGTDIYDRLLKIQEINNLGPERDISKVVDGELVPGKDGFVDLIYPDEKLKLY